MAVISVFSAGILLLNLLSCWTVTAELQDRQTDATPPIYTSNTVPRITTNSTDNDPNYTAPYFPLLGFKEYANNPVMAPNPANNWESAYLYNPSAIVVDDMIWLLYRAQNQTKTSSIGLAWSTDGYNFTRYSKPVLTATEPYENVGGTEDPRVIRVNGTFYMTYTGYDEPNRIARLCMATSTDLVNWTKHGPILPDVVDTLYNWNDTLSPYVPRSGWSKSGAILNEPVNGVYYMQFGDSYLYSANSTDLIHWNYTTFQPVPFAQRLNTWEQGLMESAAPPVKTRDGMWLKMYNGVGTGLGGYAPGSYNTGQMLLDPANFPQGPPLARLDLPLLQPTSVRERAGQVDNVVFSEGLVQYKGKWFMYFGEGDAYLGVATTAVQP